jgi:hypothetical protein
MKLRIELPTERAPDPTPSDSPSNTSETSIALAEQPVEATDLLQFLLQSVATGVARTQKSPRSHGLGAGVHQRGGRDLKAVNRNNSKHIEVQPTEFTTTQQVENGSEGQETGAACSNVVNPILPSVSALDPMAKALWVVLARWAASGDLQELRRALSQVLAEIA